MRLPFTSHQHKWNEIDRDLGPPMNVTEHMTVFPISRYHLCGDPKCNAFRIDLSGSDHPQITGRVPIAVMAKSHYEIVNYLRRYVPVWCADPDEPVAVEEEYGSYTPSL